MLVRLNKKIVILALFPLMMSMHGLIHAKSPRNFQEAKKAALLIWDDHRETFYCGCAYDKQGIINFKSCEYKPEDIRKAKRISWEHVIPVSWYGKQLPCWKSCDLENNKKYNGRKCCQKSDKNFRKMESDLHNLVPAIREVNSARSNYYFGEFYPENKENKYNFNGCQIIIDDRYRVVEPRDEVKGMVARIYFYMADKYAIDLSKHQKHLLYRWNKQYPPSEWERRWDKKVAKLQGDNNQYITKWSPKGGDTQ